MGSYTHQITPNVDGAAVAYGTVAWVDPQYAGVEDGTDFAHASFSGSDLSEWIMIYQFLQVPAFNVHDTITGVGCLVNGRCDVDGITRITDCQIVSTASGLQVLGSSTLDTSKPFTTDFKYYECGGSTEMWGLSQSAMKSWLQSKFLGFQFAVSEETGAAAEVDIDGMYIIIYFDRRARIKCMMGMGI